MNTRDRVPRSLYFSCLVWLTFASAAAFLLQGLEFELRLARASQTLIGIALLLLIGVSATTLAARRANDVGIQFRSSSLRLGICFWFGSAVLFAPVALNELLNGRVLKIGIAAIGLPAAILTLWPSQPGLNKYGPNPNEVTP